MKFALEDAADRAVAVWWACATSEDNKFSMGVIDSPYNSYYFAARANAFVRISEWLIGEMNVKDFAAIVIAEEIMAAISEIGQTPVRSTLSFVQEQREQNIAEITELLRPSWH